jgi:hypothetical protein
VTHPPFAATILSIATLAGCAAVTNDKAARVTGPEPERRATERVLDLLPPGFDLVIAIIDPDGVPDSAAVRRLDAFTVAEPDGTIRRRIYLNRESLVVREAVKGTQFYLTALAAIIVHEAVHVRGGSETDAREAETRFFADLLARGLVAVTDGDRYLALLRARESADGHVRRDLAPPRR